MMALLRPSSTNNIALCCLATTNIRRTTPVVSHRVIYSSSSNTTTNIAVSRDQLLPWRTPAAAAARAPKTLLLEHAFEDFSSMNMYFLKTFFIIIASFTCFLPTMLATNTTVVPNFLNNYYLMEVSPAKDITTYKYNLHHEYIDVRLEANSPRHNGPASLNLTTVTDVATSVYLVYTFRSSRIQ